MLSQSRDCLRAGLRSSSLPTALLSGGSTGSGREPWYLLTNERILTPEDAWQIVFAYARRWQVEMSHAV
jgi:hypothetical protein